MINNLQRSFLGTGGRTSEVVQGHQVADTSGNVLVAAWRGDTKAGPFVFYGAFRCRSVDDAVHLTFMKHGNFNLCKDHQASFRLHSV